MAGEAQVQTPGVADLWIITAVSLLNDQHPIVNVVNFVGQRPGAALPFVLLEHALSPECIVSQALLPSVDNINVRELILIIVLEDPLTVVGQIAIRVIFQRRRGGKIRRDAAIAAGPGAVLGGKRPAIVAVCESD